MLLCGITTYLSQRRASPFGFTYNQTPGLPEKLAVNESGQPSPLKSAANCIQQSRVYSSEGLVVFPR